ncbi:MAG: DnaJ domain-containing protein [Opitutales bacterium]
MPLETIWYTFEIEFLDADPLQDKIPADSEREARETIQRVYPEARVVKLLDVERRENYFARFDPTTASRKIGSGKSGKTPKAEGMPTTLDFTCPKCGRRIETQARKTATLERCPHCGWAYENRPATTNLTVIAPTELADTPPTTDPLPTTEDLEGVPWFDVLEISPTANLKQIRSAYLDLIRQYHPDKVSHLGPALVRLAEARTAALNRALKDGLRARR